MTNSTLVSNYIKFALSEEGGDDYQAAFWASDELSNLCEEDPKNALAAIVEILAINDSAKVLEILAAGPLEDLLIAHGPFVIDEIERLVIAGTKMSLLLGGVWRSEIDAEVWARVEAARSRRW